MNGTFPDNPRKTFQSLVVEQALTDSGIRDALIDEGEGKEKIVAGLIARIADNPTEQEALLLDCIGVIAVQNEDPNTIHRRGAALAIIKDLGVTPLLKAHAPALLTAYIEAIACQTEDSDPYGRSRHALLEVGKTIAPFFSEQKRETRKQVTDAWNHATHQLTSPTAQNNVYVGCKEILTSISTTALHSREILWLRREKPRLSYKEIASQVGISVRNVERLIGNMIAEGTISSKNRTRDNYRSG